MSHPNLQELDTGATTHVGLGDEGNDWLYGSAAVELLRGGEGDDYIIAHGGNDILYGDEG